MSRIVILLDVPRFGTVPRGSMRRNGAASAYKTFHRTQKRSQFLLPGCVGADPVSLTPVQFQTVKIKIRDPMILLVLVWYLEAVPCEAEWQVPIKPSIKYKKEFGF